jgi:Tol biopolymer transport system component
MAGFSQGMRVAVTALLVACPLLTSSCQPSLHPGVSCIGDDDALDLRAPVWSPDGTRLAVWGIESGDPFFPRGEIRLLDPVTGRLTELTVSESYGSNVYPSWSPDGAKIVFSSTAFEPRGIWIIEAAGGAPRVLAEGNVPAWSPDGRRIAFVCNMSEEAEANVDAICLLDLGDNAVTTIYSSTVEFMIISSLSWSADGEYLAFDCYSEEEIGATAQDEICVLAIDNGEMVQITRGGSNSCPSWSPNGQMIAYSGASEWMNRTLRIMKVDGTCLIEPLDVTGIDCPAWSPDGRQIAFEYERRIYLLDMAAVLGQDFVDNGGACECHP